MNKWRAQATFLFFAPVTPLRKRIQIDAILFAVFFLTQAAVSPTAEVFTSRDCFLLIFHPSLLT